MFYSTSIDLINNLFVLNEDTQSD